jgi:hypothetical protein
MRIQGWWLFNSGQAGRGLAGKEFFNGLLTLVKRAPTYETTQPSCRVGRMTSSHGTVYAARFTRL